MSQNDTQDNPHNPMYGIYDAGADGSLLTLIGTEPTISGGNSDGAGGADQSERESHRGHPVQ